MTRSYVGWLWLLSGLPVALALMLLPPSARLACFIIFVVLETGHSLSPIVLAWTHSGFRRQVIYASRRKYILLPALMFLVCVAIGAAAQAGVTTWDHNIRRVPTFNDWSNPFLLLAWVYSTCNLYHFGMQNFGVWRLLRRSKTNDLFTVRGGAGINIIPGIRRSRIAQSPEGDDCQRSRRNEHGIRPRNGSKMRRSEIRNSLAMGQYGSQRNRWERIFGGADLRRWFQITIVAGGTVAVYLTLPRLFHGPWVFFLLTGIVSVNHWVVDLGLSYRVAKRGWVFIAGVLAAGLVGFVWVVPTPGGMMIRMIPVIICARLGLGFVHFLYSRWVWRLSDPIVRATIGRGRLAA